MSFRETAEYVYVHEDKSDRVEVVNLEFTGSISSGLPSGIAGGSTEAAGGSFSVIPESGDSYYTSPSLWNRITEGNPLYIESSSSNGILGVWYIAKEVVFTPDSIDVTFSKSLRSFSRTVRHGPLINRMHKGWNIDPASPPSWSRPIDVVWAHVNPYHVVNRCFYKAGYYTVPPRNNDTVIDLPFQGSTLPDLWNGGYEGLIYYQYSNSDVNQRPSLILSEDMSWATDMRTSAGPRREAGYHIHGHFLVPEVMYGAVTVTYHFSQGNYVKISISRSRDITITVEPNGTTTTIAASAWAGQRLVRFTGSSLNKHCRVHAGSRATGSIAFNATTAGDNSYLFNGVEIQCENGGRIAGVQCRMTTAADLNNHYLGSTWVPTAKINTFMTAGGSFPVRSIKDEIAGELLDSIADDLIATWWVDEQGIANFYDTRTLFARSATKSFDALKDIGDYSIDGEALSNRKGATITYSEISQNTSARPRIDVANGSGDIEPDEPAEIVFSPGDDEEWIMPDFNLLPGSRNIDLFNRKHGSFFGGTSPNGGFAYPGFSGALAGNPWTYKCTLSGSISVSLKSPRDMAELYSNVRDIGLPVIRARGLLKRIKASTVVGDASPELMISLDASEWITSEARAINIGTFITSGMPVLGPSFSSITLPYSRDITLGQVIKVRDGDGVAFGYTSDCLILGYTHKPNQNATILDVIELTRTPGKVTWRTSDKRNANSDLTWAQQEAIAQSQGITYAAVEAGNQTITGG